MPEVPTDEYVDTRQSGNGNVLGIDALGVSKDSFLNVPVGQLTGLLGEFHVFPVRFCHCTQDLAYASRSCFKLQAGKVRQNNNSLPGLEKAEKLHRGLSKLDIQATTNNRRICIDSASHTV